MVDLRFATALQLMASLAHAASRGGETRSSSQLAEGLGIAPSVVRKLLVPLVRDGLVRSFMGAKGGVCLAHPSSEITLRAIYASVVGDKEMFCSRENVPSKCVVSAHIGRAFEALASELEGAILDKLGTRTLEGFLAELCAADERSPCQAALFKIAPGLATADASTAVKGS